MGHTNLYNYVILREYQLKNITKTKTKTKTDAKWSAYEKNVQ